jgi:hypothetical protein
MLKIFKKEKMTKNIQTNDNNSNETSYEVLGNFDLIAKIFEYCRISEGKVIVRARVNSSSPEHTYYFEDYNLDFLKRTLRIWLKATVGEDKRRYGLYYSNVKNLTKEFGGKVYVYLEDNDIKRLMFHLSDEQLEEIRNSEYDFFYKNSPYRREKYIPKYSHLLKSDPVKYHLEEFKEDTDIHYEEEFLDKNNCRHYIVVKKEKDYQYLSKEQSINYDIYVVPECNASSSALLMAEQVGTRVKIINFVMGELSNKGIGKKILEILEKVAKNEGATEITGILSSVDETEDSGHGRNIFYEKCGYMLNKNSVMKIIK